jgi:hypothetical protein
MSEQEKMTGGPELVPDLAQDLALAEFELLLARAMARVDAPEGFAERVVARAEADMVAASTQVSEARPGAPGPGVSGSGAPGPGVSGMVVMPKRQGLLRMQAWVGGAVAAALALGMFGAGQLHLRHEREQKAALANQQFEAAVRVTDRALAQTRDQLERAGLKLGQ